MKIYLAGPMFIESQIMYNELLSAELRSSGLEVYAPNENRVINDKERTDITGAKIYRHDIEEIEKSNVLVCQIADCPGTMWEAGYMDCLARKVNSLQYLGVIGLTTDTRLKTKPDVKKEGIENQTMYLNQFMIGGMQLSLGICTTRDELVSRLMSLKEMHGL